MDEFTPEDPLESPDEEAEAIAAEQRLQDYYKAMEEEFSNGVAYEDGKLTPAEIKERTKELLTQAVPKAVGTMLYLSQHAKAETVRMKCATYIIDKAVGKDVGGLVGDPMEELLASINRTRSDDES